MTPSNLSRLVDTAVQKHESYVMTPSGLNPEIEQVLLANPFFIQESVLADWYDSRHGVYVVNSTFYLLDRAKMTVTDQHKAIVAIVGCHLCLPRDVAEDYIRASKLVPLFEASVDDVVATLNYIHGVGMKPSGELGFVAEILADVDTFLPYFLSSTDDIRTLLRYSDRHRYSKMNSIDFLEAFRQDYGRIVPNTPAMKLYLDEHMESMHTLLDSDLAYEAMFG